MSGKQPLSNVGNLLLYISIKSQLEELLSKSLDVGTI